MQTNVQRAARPVIRGRASSNWLALVLVAVAACQSGAPTATPPRLALFLVAGGSSLGLGLLCVMLTAWLFRHERIVFGVTN